MPSFAVTLAGLLAWQVALLWVLGTTGAGAALLAAVTIDAIARSGRQPAGRG
ncbi:hypothetical protein [Sorangium sp. So ce1097]|uniref:hypothetical protein n=1 Tax=Sorangium sp. So ce1097 TaxID=3133330 RepID=UPI003F5E03DC